MHDVDPPARPLVVHVLALDRGRGAQRYARGLREALGQSRYRHRTLTIFHSATCVLDADVKLDVPRTRWLRSGVEPRGVVALRTWLRDHQPALAVVHGSDALKYLALAAPFGPPAVYYRIGLTQIRARHGLRRAFHSLLLRRARRIAGVSEEVLADLRDTFGIDAARLTVIPNARDPDVFFPAARRHSRPVPVVTFVGYLDESKRPAWFVEMVRRLRAERVPLIAQVVGEGPLGRELEPAAAEAGVSLLGFRDDISDILRATDILVFTSVPDEGMPGVFIEAGLSGVPVVTTDVPGAQTVVRDGLTGFVVGASDFEALLARVGELLRNPELRGRMAAAARRQCLKHFTMHRSAGHWDQLITAVLAREHLAGMASRETDTPCAR